jgi:glutathione S-transferase
MLSAALCQQQKLKEGLRIGMRFSQVAALASSFLFSGSRSFSMSSSTASSAPSWADVAASVGKTEVGQALDKESKLRSTGQGSAHVQNKLRLFDSKEKSPAITFFRDHAGWCPYCQKTMLLIEEKKVPIKIELVPMRSYGDKPEAFLRKVPSGLLPAIEVNGQIITESSVIMDLLDRWHSPEDGYLPMMPAEDDEEGRRKYQRLARLERELFSWWCTVLFRPEMPGGGMLSGLLGGGGMSGAMQAFMDCLSKVDAALTETKGPWFFDHDYPTMIDFVFVSHVERMLASCAYWKGLDIRDPKWNLPGINAWLNAFEKRGMSTVLENGGPASFFTWSDTNELNFLYSVFRTLPRF